ncbi:MAG TPA: alpha/beta hydrolase [Devosia sp.]|nr:alpha/beta hydrolase [Devosia sp.]
MKIADTDILIQPGWKDSGEGHWQRRWAGRFPNASIIEQADWNRPLLADWIDGIERHVAMATRPVVIVAHSLGVPALAHAAQRLTDGKVRGAFLVAPPDLLMPDQAIAFPDELKSFANPPRDPLPFPSMMVLSTDDPFGSVEHGVDLATAWGSDVHLAGPAGHINLDSGHGPWPEGLLMFTRLMQRLEA